MLRKHCCGPDWMTPPADPDSGTRIQWNKIFGSEISFLRRRFFTAEWKVSWTEFIPTVGDGMVYLYIKWIPSWHPRWRAALLRARGCNNSCWFDVNYTGVVLGPKPTGFIRPNWVSDLKKVDEKVVFPTLWVGRNFKNGMVNSPFRGGSGELNCTCHPALPVHILI